MGMWWQLVAEATLWAVGLPWWTVGLPTWLRHELRVEIPWICDYWVEGRDTRRRLASVAALCSSCTARGQSYGLLLL